MDLEKKSKQEDNMSDELCPACKMIGIEKKKSEHSKNELISCAIQLCQFNGSTGC